MMMTLKRIPKQAGCYKQHQLLLAFLCVFCSESLLAVAVSPFLPLFLQGFLAGSPAWHKEEEEEEEAEKDGRFTGPGCAGSRGALLRPAAFLPLLLAQLGGLCLQQVESE